MVLAGALAACGGGENTAPQEAPKTVSYSGRVTDENGAPLAGIKITLENRVTDKFTTVITQADGSFSANVNAGTYDILFDDPDAENYISLQKTAIDLQEDHPGNEVQIKSTGGIPSSILTGTVTGPDGAPAANRRILLLPLVASYSSKAGETKAGESHPPLLPSALPDLKLVQADTQGKFSVLLNEVEDFANIDFDLIVLSPEAEEFDFTHLKNGRLLSSEEEEEAYYEKARRYLRENATEIVDIEKPQGPMHVDVRLGSAIQNLSNSLGLPSNTPEAVKQRSELEQNSTNATSSLRNALIKIKENSIKGFLNLIPSAYAWTVTQPFTLYIFQEQKRGIVAFLDAGKLTNNPGRNRFTFSSLTNAKPPLNSLGEEEKAKYGGDVSTLLAWDEFELSNDTKGGKNDYFLTLSQQRARECLFRNSNNKNDIIEIKPPLSELYQPRGAIKTTAKFNLESANGYIWTAYCSIPIRN